MAITTINQDNFEEKVTNAASPVLLFGMLAVAAALLYVISYLLSCRFFQKQEF